MLGMFDTSMFSFLMANLKLRNRHQGHMKGTTSSFYVTRDNQNFGDYQDTSQSFHIPKIFLKKI